MTFMHMAALTAAAGDIVDIQLNDLTVIAVGSPTAIAEIAIKPTGDVTSTINDSENFSFNWLEPIELVPGGGYQIMRGAASPDEFHPARAPAVGVWTKLYIFSETDQSGAVTVAGTGYNVNDKLTLVGGTFSQASIYNIDTLTGGAGTGVATISLDDEGVYAIAPTVPGASTTTDGGGSGCFLTPNMGGGPVEFITVAISSGDNFSQSACLVSIRLGTGPVIDTAVWEVRAVAF